MCRYIIFNNMGYIHSINTFLRQKVSAHKRHRLLAFFQTLFEKTPKELKIYNEEIEKNVKGFSVSCERKHDSE